MITTEGRYLTVDLNGEFDYFQQHKGMIVDEYLEDLLKMDMDEILVEEECYKFTIKLRDRAQALMFKRLTEGRYLTVDLNGEFDYFQQHKGMIVDEYLEDLLKMDMDEILVEEECYKFTIKLRDRAQALMFKRLLDLEFEEFDRQNHDYE